MEGLVLGWGAGGWGPGSWVLALAASCPGTSPCPSAGLSVYSVPLPLCQCPSSDPRPPAFPLLGEFWDGAGRHRLPRPKTGFSLGQVESCPEVGVASRCPTTATSPPI